MVNKTMKTIYRKVEIKSEQDLPKEDDDYIVHSKSFGWIGLVTWKGFENANYPEYNQYLWLLNYDWYFQPIEPREPLKNHPVYTLNCDKCKRAYSSADAFPEDQLCDKCFAEKYLRHHKKEHPKTAEKILDKICKDNMSNIHNMKPTKDMVIKAMREYHNQFNK